MKFILSIVIISLLVAHPQHHHKHHSHSPEFHFGFHINKYHNNYCHICSRIIDSFFINGDKVLVIKTHHPLSNFKRKNLVKKIRKHLGFLSKRVKFRFVI